jgi:hypothetical protein
MSEMEYNKGILIPTHIDTEHFGQDEYETYSENGYVVLDGEIYTVKWEVQRGEIDQINNVRVCDETGYIFFETYHYNGGAHWTEVVESKL